MFKPEKYSSRRSRLKESVSDGIAIFPGNNESPMNYPANTYHYRQDSSFLYFFGLDKPGLAGVMDLESDEDILFGDDHTLDDVIWMGQLPRMKELGEKTGIRDVRPYRDIDAMIGEAIARGRKVHYLPVYRDDTLLELERLLGRPHAEVRGGFSQGLINGVVALRSVKDELEISEIEKAIDITREMHTTVMRMAQPGIYEREIAGKIEGIALAHGSAVSFPIILSMDGQTLHNHYHGNLLEKGRMMVTDAGAETTLHYSGDITRTVPVGGVFSQKQKDIYEIVLEAEVTSIEKIRPGIPYREIHMDAARTIARGLKDLGLMKGNVDDAVRDGAHALFFPHGLGHHMGLDVHDMEGLGEDNVGYDDEIRRSSQFGTAYLRMGKRLQSGYVLTVEPGIYFIPALIDKWESERLHEDFIIYEKISDYTDIGGIRIEDDVLVTNEGRRVLGNPIPKTIREIETIMKS